MKQRAHALLPSAVAISAAAHVLLFLLVPYRPMQLPRTPTQVLIPVNLIEMLPVVSTPALTPSRRVQAEQPAVAEAPSVTEVPPAEEPPLAEQTQVSTLEAASTPAAEPVVIVDEPGGGEQAAPASAPTVAQAPAAAVPAQPSAEIAAYKVILSSLRDRIIRDIRYPPLARASGWKGTVVLAIRLDAAGNLLQSVVRKSSGYEVLDRAASALIRKVTPVENPLGLPVSIEIPIVYELK